MPRPRTHVPTCRLHKLSGQAIVTINWNGTRRDVLLDKYGTPECRTEYHRVLAELNASGPVYSPGGLARTELTINELLMSFAAWATTHYRAPSGNPVPKPG